MPETMLCAKTDEPAADHPFHLTYDCPGDAGGPLVITSGYQKVQIGKPKSNLYKCSKK